MSEQRPPIESLDEKPPKVEQVRIFHRLKSLIKTISGRHDLRVTDEMEPEILTQHLLEGRDPNDSWFRFQTRDPKTKRVIKEYVYIPKVVTERKEEVALGKAAHEAGHVIITQTHQIIPEEFFKSRGFSELIASAEERPTDHVVRVRYPGAGDWVDEARRDSVIDGEIVRKQVRHRTGSESLFGSFCSLVVYDRYYTEAEREHLQPEVLELLEVMRPVVTKIEECIPPRGSTENSAIYFSKKRAKIVHDELLPIAQPLLEKDIQKEVLRQMLQGAMSPQKSEDDASQDISQEVMDSLSEDEKKEVAKELQKEIAEQRAEEIKDALRQDQDLDSEELNEKLDKVNQQLQELKDRIDREAEGKTSEELLQQAQEQLEGAEEMPIPIDKLSQELKEKIQEIFEQLTKDQQEILRKAAEQLMEELMQMIIKTATMGAGSGEPVEVSQEQMQEMFGAEGLEEGEGGDEDEKEGGRGLPRSSQKKSGSVKKSTKEKKPVDEKVKKKLEEQKKLEERMKEAERRELPSRTSEYDKIYREVMPTIDKLFDELEQVFYPEIRGGMVLRSEGSGINLQAVFRMISQKKGGAKEVDYRIFESSNHPELRDFDITLLVDLSGSMASAGKIDEAFKSVIILSEVLNRLGVRFEVLGFQDVLIPYKNFADNLDNDMRNKLMIMPLELIGDYYDYDYDYESGRSKRKRNDTSRGFNNNPDHNDDGPCLREASDRLALQHGSRKVLIVISDGQPAGSHSDESDLYESVEYIKKNTDQRLLALGLGRGTEHVKTYYPTAIPNIDAHDLPEVLGGVLEALLINPDAVFDDEAYQGRVAENEDDDLY